MLAKSSKLVQKHVIVKEWNGKLYINKIVHIKSIRRNNLGYEC